MDKNGNYKVVYGLKLNKIPKGDIKVIINGHGDSKGIGDRSIEEIAAIFGFPSSPTERVTS
jgi:hypothetical protein